MSDGGKGSKARPIDVPLAVYESNWDRIFGKKKQKCSKREDGSCDNKDCTNSSCELEKRMDL